MLAPVLYAVVGATGLALGAIGAVVVPVAALIWAVFGVLVGALAWLRAPAAPAAASRRRDGLITGGATVAGGLVLTGIVALWGPGVGFGVVVLPFITAGLASLWLRRAPRRPFGGAAGHGSPRPDEQLPAAAQPPAIEAEALPTAELCLLWQHTSLVLQSLPSSRAGWEAVQIRECLLDELERRDPDGFARWLEAGARAGTDPGRYLSPDR